MSLKNECSLKDCTKLRNLILENPDLPLLTFVGYEKAIEIVKQGCVAVANNATTRDDVCEWKYKHPFGDFPGCKNLNYSISRDSNWKYCPYCGKKIKVVE